MKRIVACAVLAWLSAGMALKGADIEVVKPGGVKTAIDLTGLTGERSHVTDLFLQTLAEDLKRSGWFSIAAAGRGAIRCEGSVTDARGWLTVRLRCQGVATLRRYLNRDFSGETRRARQLAHEVCDAIVKAVHGVEGIASTRIAMVGSIDGRKDLFLCDYDGENVVRITADGVVCLTPSWAPDGQGLLYTSFLRGFPDVYWIDLTSKRRQPMIHFAGLNAGARISPDGSRMVMTLSKDGNPDLYVMDRRTRRLTRLTRTRHAAEASPCWSPDGRRIAYVSDSDGSPQVYVIDDTGGNRRRLTFQGSENVAPDWGPDGRIAFSSRRERRYQVHVLDMETGRSVRVSPDDADYEDPSWAPNGRHIVCTRTQRYQSDLYVLDTMGDPAIRLTTIPGDWYSPAWSPR